MFYSAQILARKGPLGIVWLAAHHDKKYLKKHQVSGTDLIKACNSIIQPEAPLALRLSGQLMLGVVRIYYKQIEYLAQDANGTLVKLRQVGKPADVDLPPENNIAPSDAINLPDSLFDDPFASSAGLNLDIPLRGDTPVGTPRGTPRRSSIAFVEEEHSNLGTPLFGGSQRYGEPETFETFNDAFLDAEFRPEDPLGAIDEPERARAAPAADAGGPSNLLAGLDESTPGAPVEDGDIPMPDQEEVVATPASGALPASPRALSPDAPFDLPSVEPFEEPAADDRTGTDASKRPTSAAREARRRRVRRDVGAEGRDGTKLPGEQIKALLQDRAPLLTDRSTLAVRGRGCMPLPQNHVAVQSGSAAESALFRPATAEVMDPRLFAAFRSATGIEDTGMPPPPPRLPATRAAATPEAQLAATPQADGAEAPDEIEVPMPENDVMDYQFDDGAPSTAAAPATAGEEDRIEGSPQPLGSALKRRRLSLSGSLHVTSSGSVLTEELESDAQGEARREFGSWLTEQFSSSLKVSKGRREQAELAPQEGLLKGRSRLFAARAFFQALSLQKDGHVTLSQAEPYEEIVITPGKVA